MSPNKRKLNEILEFLLNISRTLLWMWVFRDRTKFNNNSRYIHMIKSQPFNCSVAKLCLTLCNPMKCSTSFPVLQYLLEFAQTHVLWVSDAPPFSSSGASFSPCPQYFPASLSFPVSRLFTSGGQKHWSFSFSISLSNEYSGLISFRIHWFDLLAVQMTQESSPSPQFKSINQHSDFFTVQLTSIHDYWKNHSSLIEPNYFNDK